MLLICRKRDGSDTFNRPILEAVVAPDHDVGDVALLTGHSMVKGKGLLACGPEKPLIPEQSVQSGLIGGRPLW